MASGGDFLLLVSAESEQAKTFFNEFNKFLVEHDGFLKDETMEEHTLFANFERRVIVLVEITWVSMSYLVLSDNEETETELRREIEEFLKKYSELLVMT